MNSNLESFCPKLRTGRVIPQGSRIIFETDNPYNQIILPVILADLILLCSGQFSVREIIEKIYKKQGAVPFKSMLTALHLLHQGGFFENGDELVLSSHLQSWMEAPKRDWNLSWRFGQRMVAAQRSPFAFYLLTLVTLLGSIFGLQFFPSQPFAALINWSTTQGLLASLGQLILVSSLLQSIRYGLCGVQLLLLTSKAYNVALRLSPWGLHLHVGDEANDLFENRLYTSMFHVSQISAPWFVVFACSIFGLDSIMTPLVTVAALMSFWELNPFTNSEGRKLIRALLIANDRDVVSWHFESSTLINSINPESRRRDHDFVKICAAWGVFYLLTTFALLLRTAVALGPLGFHPMSGWRAAVSLVIAGAWLMTLYFVVQAMVDIVSTVLVRPSWTWLKMRFSNFGQPNKTPWPHAVLIKSIEGLPLFSHFHEQFLDKIVAGSEAIAFREGANILTQGDPARELFVLLEGEVDVVRQHNSNGEAWSISLGAVSVFGESSLVDETPRGASVVARSKSVVLRVPIELIKEVAKEAQSVRQLEVFRNAILVNQFFASSPVFRSLSTSSVDYLCSRGTLEYFDQGMSIFRQGETGDSLYLILRGSVEIEIHGASIKNLHQGSFFGEIALIANIPRTATIRSVVPSVFFKISADAFWEVLVQHMDLGVFIENVSETRLKEDLAIVPQLGNAS